MAVATVTVKLSPKELRVVCDALHVFAHVSVHAGDAEHPNPLEGYILLPLGVLQARGRQAREILDRIGLD